VSTLPYILGGVAAFLVLRAFLRSGEPESPPPLPSAPPRRSRRRAATPPPISEDDTRATVPVPAPSASVVPVVSRLRPVRSGFATRAALRRAIVAQEVLGPPVALRPPRR